jgi:hypothetical protein
VLGDLLDERAALGAQPHDRRVLTRLGAGAHRPIAAAARGLGERRVDRDHAIRIGDGEPADEGVVGPGELARARRDLDDLDPSRARHPELGDGRGLAPATTEIDTDEPGERALQAGCLSLCSTIAGYEMFL